jgi:methylthioribose-1-phosphate isomerase
VAWRRGDPDRVVQLRLTRFELLKGLGLADPSATDLPIFPNWPDVPRIARAVGAHLVARPDAPPALLIADHGVTVWGADLSQARNRLECLESMCHVLCLTGAGDGSPVTPARDLAKGAPS